MLGPGGGQSKESDRNEPNRPTAITLRSPQVEDRRGQEVAPRATLLREFRRHGVPQMQRASHLAQIEDSL
eukprot:2985260-Pyramimonas_sp.AAC.1